MSSLWLWIGRNSHDWASNTNRRNPEVKARLRSQCVSRNQLEYRRKNIIQKEGMWRGHVKRELLCLGIKHRHTKAEWSHEVAWLCHDIPCLALIPSLCCCWVQINGSHRMSCVAWGWGLGTEGPGHFWIGVWPWLGGSWWETFSRLPSCGCCKQHQMALVTLLPPSQVQHPEFKCGWVPCQHRYNFLEVLRGVPGNVCAPIQRASLLLPLAAHQHREPARLISHFLPPSTRRSQHRVFGAADCWCKFCLVWSLANG